MIDEAGFGKPDRRKPGVVLVPYVSHGGSLYVGLIFRHRPGLRQERPVQIELPRRFADLSNDTARRAAAYGLMAEAFQGSDVDEDSLDLIPLGWIRANTAFYVDPIAVIAVSIRQLNLREGKPHSDPLQDSLMQQAFPPDISKHFRDEAMLPPAARTWPGAFFALSTVLGDGSDKAALVRYIDCSLTLASLLRFHSLFSHRLNHQTDETSIRH